MKVTITRAYETIIHLQVEGIGYIQLYRFSSVPPSNHPPGRPWHIVGCGQFFASADECIRHLEQIVPSNKGQEHSGITYTGYGANTHAPSGN